MKTLKELSEELVEIKSYFNYYKEDVNDKQAIVDLIILSENLINLLNKSDEGIKNES